MSDASHTSARLTFSLLVALMLLASPMFATPALADLNGDPGGPYTGIAGENVQFRATAFSDAGRVVEYRWDFGDGNSGIRSGATINHKYGSAGTYTVSLTVVDVDGLESAPETTIATIVEATTTTAPGPSTTTTTTPTSTTTTAPGPTTTTAPGPTTTTTPTSTTTTTPTSTTTTAPGPTSTTTAPTSTTSTLPTGTTGNTSATTTTGASEVEDVTPAEEISATLFSLVPDTVSPGGEIALTVALTAAIPGRAGVQFLFDGRALGEIAVLNVVEGAGEGRVDAVFTRTLPAGLTSGSYRVDVVAAGQPTRILASQTIEVVADLSSDPDQTERAAPATPTPESTPFSMIAILAVGGTAVMAAAGLAVKARDRRRTVVRRVGK